MKKFFYKSLIVFFLFIFAFHFTFGLAYKKILTEINNSFSKDNIEKIKIKIRNEANNAIKKDVYIKPEDARIINKLIEKIKSDLKK